MEGEGKYHEICKSIMTNENADLVALIIVNGSRGSGFSVLGVQPALMELPTFLGQVMEQVEHDLQENHATNPSSKGPAQGH